MQTIAICGIDGSGKTTQVEMLKQYMQKNKIKVHATKSPTNWYRKDLRVAGYLSGELETNKMLIHELALLSASDKLRQLQMEINEKNYNYIIYDRYLYSSYAYFMCRGMDLDYLMAINVNVPKPDITIYLDISAEDAYSRILKRDGTRSNKEEKDIKFLRTVREIFINQPWGKTEKYYIIDGTRSRDKVFEEVLQIYQNNRESGE